MASVAQDRLNGARSSLAIKAPVRVATTANITLSGLQTIDGVTVAAEDRVLVKNQTTSSDNGIYVVDTGSWSRAPDFDGNRDVAKGTAVYVNEGTAQTNTWWRVTTSNPIVIDTSNIVFALGLISDSSAINFVQAGANAYTRTVQDKERDIVALTDYANTDGTQVVADRATNNATGIANAIAAAALLGLSLYIPPAETPGYYYKTESAISITHDTFCMYGAGTQSLFVIANGSGANCFTLSGAIHGTYRDFGIYGTAGSGHGIEITSSSHYNKLSRIWIGFVDGDGIKVTSGQSNLFTEIDVDQNIGYRPATLTGGLTDGSIAHGIHVPSDASGNTNNQSFVNCRINAAGDTYSLKVGTNGASTVESFSWTGGLIQGASSYQEVFLHTTDGSISGAHIEPPVGTTANYVVTFDGCTNTVIRNCGVQGDAQWINACTQTGFEHVRGCGMVFGLTSDSCFARDCQYANITSGPAGGQVLDKAPNTDIRHLKNASSERFATGNNLNLPISYRAIGCEDWSGGVPAGLTLLGSPTVTQETTTVKTGTYSARVASTGLTQGFRIAVQPANLVAGRRVYVRGWAYNVGVAGAFSVGGIEGGTGAAYYWSSQELGQWERFQVTFTPQAAATGFSIDFVAGSAATFIVEDIHIFVEDVAEPRSTNRVESFTSTAASTALPYGHTILACTVASSAHYTMLAPVIGAEKRISQTCTSTLGYAVRAPSGVNFMTTAGSSFNQLVLAGKGNTIAMSALSDVLWAVHGTLPTGSSASTF